MLRFWIAVLCFAHRRVDAHLGGRGFHGSAWWVDGEGALHLDGDAASEGEALARAMRIAAVREP